MKLQFTLLTPNGPEVFSIGDTITMKGLPVLNIAQIKRIEPDHVAVNVEGRTYKFYWNNPNHRETIETFKKQSLFRSVQTPKGNISFPKIGNPEPFSWALEMHYPAPKIPKPRYEVVPSAINNGCDIFDHKKKFRMCTSISPKRAEKICKGLNLVEQQKTKPPKTFDDVVIPVMNWLKKHHPDGKIIIDSADADLVNVVKSF